MEDLLWWFLFAVVMVVVMVIYPLWVLRSALRGRQWAKDTLEAMRYVGGDMMTTSVWLSLPPEPEREPQAPPERFVA